jgi:rare lipoprotein A
MKKIIIGGWLVLTSLTFEATYYGGSFHGNLTYSGEKFDKNKMTCASNHFKIGTMLEVTNPINHKSVVVKVNDKGRMKNNVIDLSERAFKKIASLKEGRIKVTIKKFDEL